MPVHHFRRSILPLARLRGSLALCAGMGLVACGVPDEGPSAGAFKAKVEKICKDSNARVNALTRMDPTDGASIARGLEQTIEAQRVAVSEIRGIATPKGSRADVDAWLEHVDATLVALEKVGAALTGGDAGDVATNMATARSEADAANQAAGKLNLDRCASTAAPLESTTTTTTSSPSESDSETDTSAGN